MSAEDSGRYSNLEDRNLFARQSRFHLIKLPETIALHAYATIIKIELSPDNGCVIDMKWSLGPLSYRASSARQGRS